MSRYNFDGFTVSVTLDEDGDWLACLMELPNVSAFADNPSAAVKELHDAWVGVKKSYSKKGEPIPVAPVNKNYSGQFNVRIDKRLHKELAIEAARAGISLNALVAQKLLLKTKLQKNLNN